MVYMDDESNRYAQKCRQPTGLSNDIVELMETFFQMDKLSYKSIPYVSLLSTNSSIKLSAICSQLRCNYFTFVRVTSSVIFFLPQRSISHLKAPLSSGDHFISPVCFFSLLSQQIICSPGRRLTTLHRSADAIEYRRK